jgi:hypothetical protein
LFPSIFRVSLDFPGSFPTFPWIFPGFSLDLHTFPTTFPGSVRGVTATVTSFALEAGWVTSYCEIAQRVQTKRLDGNL